MPDFEFFTVQKMSSDIFFDKVSGELGLGFDLPDNGDSIITSLKKGEYIDEEKVYVHIDTGKQNPELRFRSQVSIGGYEPHFLYNGNETFHTYPLMKVSDKQWDLEVRGFIFHGEATKLKYKTRGVVDSFSRGIQLPILDFARFAKQLLELYKDDEKFYCMHYKCYFFDTECDERGLKDRLGNFTLRFSDSLGFTLSPDVYMVEGVYKIGEEIMFKTCDV